MKLALINIILFSFFLVKAKEVPYTLEDRDRMIRLEVEQKAIRNEFHSELNSVREEIKSVRGELNSLRNEMNYKFDAVDSRISNITTLMLWGFGIIFSLILCMFGYLIWDRRTALIPANVKADKALSKYEKLILALKELATTDKKLAAVLRSYGLM